jgi:SCY1-like protein 1
MLSIDPEKDVRDEAFKTIKQYMQKLEKVSEQPEVALDMEKDVQSCALDLKNETSWTSWAVNSLSTKMSSYKNKTVQPSVALNTQPLGPPPGMETSKPTNSAASGDKKPEPLAASADTKRDQKQLQQQKKETSSSNFTTSFETKNQSSAGGGAGGWGFDENFDDDEWKDMEDGELMEPLEPVQSTNFGSKTNKSNANLSSGNSDWSSDWKNSFEEVDKGKTSQGLPSASSYFTDPMKNEEDLFSSLVKDVSISNKVKFTI